ncbi:MAG: trypsin-like peptidase domain-containing protein, partial [Chloroflexia bacterium]|nr:trypsin-like peptidase domain-containing protein [Chloroflexia bacterium]
MTSIPLTPTDRRRLIDELIELPAWALGGVPGVRGVLLAAGLPSKWIAGHPLSGTPTIDAANVISSLEGLGHLANRPTHRALGALVEYLLQETPHREGQLFLAYLIDRYELVTDLEYLRELEEHYPLFQAPPPDTSIGLNWTPAGPEFPWRGPTAAAALEKIWRDDVPFLEAVFLEKGARVAQAVCLIEGKNGADLGTGFLVAPGLVLTNHHVVPSAVVAERAQARFGFRLDEAGQLQPGQAYAVQEILQHSDVQELDYALLRLAGNPVQDLGLAPLPLVAKSLQLDQRLYIIQHPAGAPQKVVLQG